MGKGKPFLEVFASALHEDYRFPILEVFAFLYALGTFASTFTFFGFLSSQGGSGESLAYSMSAAIIGSSIFIFVILIFKNVAYGLGSDLEKGIIQTLFSYPLKRSSILTAKLLSALGVSLLLFLGIQLSALCILAPDIVASHLGTILLTYAASLSFPLFLTGIILLVTLVIRRGGLALILGIVLYFALSIVSSMAMFVAVATKSPLILQILSVFSPSTALALHYGQTDVTSIFGNIWIPTFSEVLICIGASYVIVAVFFFLGYYYFCRRLSP